MDVVQLYDRCGRLVVLWMFGVYALVGCLYGMACGALWFVLVCVQPLFVFVEVVTLVLMLWVGYFGFGWIGDLRLWWHNGGTVGSCAVIVFVLRMGAVVVAATNTLRALERFVLKLLW